MPSCDINPASETYADFIVRHNNRTPETIMAEQKASCIDYVDSEFAVVYAPLAEVSPITIEKYTYTAIPSLYTLLDTTSMDASGITQNFRQPTLGLKGQGVLVGLIDTGIDYRNPLFQNPDGTSRILGIWDQTLPGPETSDISGFPGSPGFPDVPGPPGSPDSPPRGADRPLGVSSSVPEGGISYGTEFVKADIDRALQSEDPLSVVPSTDDSGHGTFMAGIAAGNTSEDLDFTGAAPLSAIGVVKLKPAKQYLRDFYRICPDAAAYQENDIMLGIKYLGILAYRYSMPLVIYIGLGTNYGSHEGTSPLGLMLQSLSRLVGICAVLPAGNEAGLRHHYMGRLQMDDEYDDVEIRVGAGERGFIAELWATAPELYTVGFVSPTGEVISRLPISLGSEIQVSFTLENTVITVNYRTSEIGSGSQFILMRFSAPTPGIWHIRVYNSILITGIFHIWLPVQGFIQEDTYFLRPDPDTTITEPANAQAPITVSTYDHTSGSIYIHSSRGYARNGLAKPDLAAPGVGVFGPGLSPSFDQEAFPMTRRTGSSVAAAHVAGAVADLFTWGIVRGNNTALSDASIRAYLIRGADRNPAYSYPSRIWGYGTLDLYQTFVRIRE